MALDAKSAAVGRERMSTIPADSCALVFRADGGDEYVLTIVPPEGVGVGEMLQASDVPPHVMGLMEALSGVID